VFAVLHPDGAADGRVGLSGLDEGLGCDQEVRLRWLVCLRDPPRDSREACGRDATQYRMGDGVFRIDSVAEAPDLLRRKSRPKAGTPAKSLEQEPSGVLILVYYLKCIWRYTRPADSSQFFDFKHGRTKC